MIRRPPLETKINHERWLVSYADFITLLFAFFVVMYSVSHVNENKYRQLSSTLESTFSSGSADTSERDRQTDEEVVEEPTENLADLTDVSSQLQEALAELVQEDKIKITGNEEWVEIELNASLLFSTGSAELAQDAQNILTDVADILSPYDNAVAIAGHTDNLPIRNETFSSNWSLSSARAVSVVDLLAYQGVQPDRLSAVGYGEYRPVVENDTEQGRARNRRVVLKVARNAVEPNKVGVETYRQDTSSEPSPLVDVEPADEQVPTSLQPVRLRGGGILFSSDPDLPRTNPPVSDQSSETAVEDSGN